MINLPDILSRYTEILDMRQMAQARLFMTRVMGELFKTDTVCLLGRDETNENILALANRPANDISYTISLEDCECRNAPLFWAFQQTAALFAHSPAGNMILQALKQQFFAKTAANGFVLLPAVYQKNSYADLVFLIAGHERMITTETIAVAAQFSNFCAAFNRMNAGFDRMEFQGRQLARSLQTVSETLQKQKTAQTGNIIGSSRQMAAVRQAILKYGPTDLSILIEGDTGTGKELAAQSLHQASKRGKGQFIPVNIAAIPESLIESELFGFVKGAFTGADKNRVGLFHEANGGTLFLDEIGDLPMACQAKLLRILQEKKYRPLGANHELPCNVRIIAATHKNIEQLVRDSLFREDLYYRLAEGKIVLPPLRERTADIPELAAWFLSQSDTGQQNFRLSGEAANYLLQQAFPGNIRQLKSVMSNACLSADDHATLHLVSVREAYESSGISAQKPATPQAIALSEGLQSGLAAFEKMVLLEAIAQNNDHRFLVAEKLKLPRRTFYNKLRKYGLEETDNA